MTARLTDAAGRMRFGRYKGFAIEDVPAYALQETRSWAEDIAEECQKELDRRVAELRASEAGGER